MSSAAETSRSDAEVEEFLRRCAATAAAGVDVNDIRDWMVTKLPRRIWLQLNANYPDGEYYHPDLSVNKHLGISYDLLKELLGSDWGRDLKWGGKGNKGVVVRAGTRDSLRRQSSDQIDAVWIWVDPTFAIPRRRPGEQIPPKDPLRIGDWRELDEKTQKEARQQYDNGDFGSCISVPDGGWASRDDHVKHDKHAEVTAGSKRSRKSSEKGLSAVGVSAPRKRRSGGGGGGSGGGADTSSSSSSSSNGGGGSSSLSSSAPPPPPVVVLMDVCSAAPAEADAEQAQADLTAFVGSLGDTDSLEAAAGALVASDEMDEASDSVEPASKVVTAKALELLRQKVQETNKAVMAEMEKQDMKIAEQEAEIAELEVALAAAVAEAEAAARRSSSRRKRRRKREERGRKRKKGGRGGGRPGRRGAGEEGREDCQRN